MGKIAMVNDPIYSKIRKSLLNSYNAFLKKSFGLYAVYGRMVRIVQYTNV